MLVEPRRECPSRLYGNRRPRARKAPARRSIGASKRWHPASGNRIEITVPTGMSSDSSGRCVKQPCAARAGRFVTNARPDWGLGSRFQQPLPPEAKMSVRGPLGPDSWYAQVSPFVEFHVKYPSWKFCCTWVPSDQYVPSSSGDPSHPTKPSNRHSRMLVVGTETVSDRGRRRGCVSKRRADERRPERSSIWRDN
jgi:hypothetical protein